MLAMLPGMYEWIVIMGIFAMGFLATVLLAVIPCWMICKEAGFPPAMSLPMLVPTGNIVLLFYLAFADWPALSNSPGYEQ